MKKKTRVQNNSRSIQNVEKEKNFEKLKRAKVKKKKYKISSNTQQFIYRKLKKQVPKIQKVQTTFSISYQTKKKTVKQKKNE